MGLCETCNHFQRDPNSARGFGGCGRWHQGYWTPEDKMADNEVLVESDEGWGMIMGPKFGCVLHEPKSPANPA
jgi:hypothetical protein